MLKYFVFLFQSLLCVLGNAVDSSFGNNINMDTMVSVGSVWIIVDFFIVLFNFVLIEFEPRKAMLEAFEKTKAIQYAGILGMSARMFVILIGSFIGNSMIFFPTAIIADFLVRTLFENFAINKISLIERRRYNEA